MAESSNVNKGDSSPTQQSSQSSLQQPQPKTASNTDVKDVRVGGNGSPVFEVKECPTPVPLPGWFEHFFPLLTYNRTFLTLYWSLVAIVGLLKEAFLVGLFMKWIALLQFVFRPTILLVQWTWWIISSLFIKPVYYVVFTIATVLGITKVLSSVFKEIIGAIDYLGDKFMNTIGVLIKYIKEQWDETSHDILQALNKLKQWAKETLEATVKAAKYILSYIKDVLKMIMPSAVYAWIVQWLKIGSIFLSSVYNFFKYLLVTFEKVLDIIKDAWKSEDSILQSSGSEKASPADPKKKEKLKLSIKPSKNLEPIAHSSPKPVEDSSKQS